MAALSAASSRRSIIQQRAAEATRAGGAASQASVSNAAVRRWWGPVNGSTQEYWEAAKWGRKTWEVDGWQETLSGSARLHLAPVFVHSSEDTLSPGFVSWHKAPCRTRTCTSSKEQMSNRREIEQTLFSECIKKKNLFLCCVWFCSSLTKLPTGNEKKKTESDFFRPL